MSGLEELSATSQEPIDYRSFRKSGGVNFPLMSTSGKKEPVQVPVNIDPNAPVSYTGVSSGPEAEQEETAPEPVTQDLTPPGEIDITTGNCHNAFLASDGTTLRYRDSSNKLQDDGLLKLSLAQYEKKASGTPVQDIFDYLNGTGSIKDSNGLAAAINAIYTAKEDAVIKIMNHLVKTDPRLSLALLQKLGFQQQKDGNSMIRVESVDSWFKNEVSASGSKINLNKTDASVQALCRFLQLVVDYVNCNPGFLNPGLKGSTDANDYSSQMPQSAYSLNAGLKYHYTSCRKSCGNNDLYRLTQTMKSRQMPVSLVNSNMCSSFNLCGGYRIGNSIKVQSGGGADSVLTKSGTTEMSNLFEDAKNKLQQVGRTLKPASDAQVKTLLQEMSAKEKEVYAIVQNMQVLLERRRLNRDGTNMEVTVEEIKACAEKQAAVSNQFCNSQMMCLKVLTQLEKMADNTREPIGTPRNVC
jgi:hypothetical protein